MKYEQRFSFTQFLYRWSTNWKKKVMLKHFTVGLVFFFKFDAPVYSWQSSDLVTLCVCIKCRYAFSLKGLIFKIFFSSIRQWKPLETQASARIGVLRVRNMLSCLSVQKCKTMYQYLKYYKPYTSCDTIFFIEINKWNRHVCI